MSSLTDALSERPDRALESALKDSRAGFAAVALFSFFINLLMLTVPVYLLQIFDRVLTSRGIDSLLYLTLVAGFALLTLAALEAVRSRVMVLISTTLEQRVSGVVLTESAVANLRGARDPSVQGLRDLSTVRTFLTSAAIFPIMDAPWTPIFLLVIFLLHPILGWLAVAGALVLLVLALINELATRQLLLRSGGASIRAMRQADATVRNADAIEAMGMMPDLVRRWHRQNGKTLALQALASNRSGGIKAASRFVRLFLQIGMFGAGAWLVLGNEITPGAMIAGSILLSRALAPVEMAIGSWRSAIGARDAYRRVRSQLVEAAPRGGQMKLPPPKGAISVEAMTFIHPSTSEPALRGIQFELEAGESLGLIGPTAAGKTTLARLLVGNLRPQAGHARLDGVDIAQWGSDEVGRYVGYLPQDVELFNGAVAENIARMGKGDPEAIVAAALLAGVHKMILRLPNGYGTEIGDYGAVLSGGMRQRIAFARALYGDPRFVVLDEPNASLDQAGADALLSTIDTLRERKVTLIVIAHHPAVLRHVDKVLVLREGQIQTFGPREDVIAQLTKPAPQYSIPKQTVASHG